MQLFSRFHLQSCFAGAPCAVDVAMIMRVAAAIRFLLVVLAVTAVAARDLREGEQNDD